MTVTVQTYDYSRSITERLYRLAPIPIEGLEYPVSLVHHSPYYFSFEPEYSDFSLQLFNREDARVLSASEITKVANAVRSKEPSREFIEYAMKNAGIDEKTVVDAYTNLHTEIWLQFPLSLNFIRAREMLLWYTPNSNLIISDELPSEKGSYIIKDWSKIIGQTITKKTGRFLGRIIHPIVGCQVDVRGVQPYPIIPVEWPRDWKKITLEVAELFGVPENTSILPHGFFGGGRGDIKKFREAVETHYCTGIRSIELIFDLDSESNPMETQLWSYHEPWKGDSSISSLMGVKKRKELGNIQS